MQVAAKMESALARESTRFRDNSREEAERRRARTAAKQTLNSGEISSAMSILESSGCAAATTTTFEKLVELTPQGKEVTSECAAKLEEVLESSNYAFILEAEIVKICIKAAPKDKTKDPTGLRFEHLQQCIVHWTIS